MAERPARHARSIPPFRRPRPLRGEFRSTTAPGARARAVMKKRKAAMPTGVAVGRSTNHLTVSQFDLLRRVADGCKDGVYEGSSYRVSARALHNRGFRRVSGSGTTWAVHITPDGTRRLQEEGERVVAERERARREEHARVALTLKKSGRRRAPSRSPQSPIPVQDTGSARVVLLKRLVTEDGRQAKTGLLAYRLVGTWGTIRSYTAPPVDVGC